MGFTMRIFHRVGARRALPLHDEKFGIKIQNHSKTFFEPFDFGLYIV
jgi:hypothetical protein